jgi:hypothetical protein
VIEIITNQFPGIGVLVSIVSVIDVAGALAWVVLVDSGLTAVAVRVIAHQAVAAFPATATIAVGARLVGIGAGCAA